MREILFRGKRVDNGEWVYGDLVHIGNKSYISYYYESALSTFINEMIEYDGISIVGVAPFIEVDPITVGQYTGLTANGKKIFEGDILEGIRYGNEERAEVLWIDKAASWGIRYSFREKNESGYTSWLNSAWFRIINNARGPVVIGNIHDNPELLEVEK